MFSPAKGTARKIGQSLALIVLLGLTLPVGSLWSMVVEGGVTVGVSRVLNGANSGTKYYGYTGGTITLPHNRGGMLSFDLFNDFNVRDHALTNFFVAEIGGSKITIPNYTTINQMVEEYVEFRGQWGAAGTNRVILAIPPGVTSFNFSNAGSQTGIEIANIRFVEGYRHIPGGFELTRTRQTGEPVVSAGRILTGEKTNRKYYGYTSGTIHLPHTEGGFLTFKVWNDQQTGYAAARNVINISVGGKRESFVQYTTSLALTEFYKEFMNQWGPAGGSDITIQVPEGIGKIDFNNAGSETGIEISDVTFTKGAPIVINYQEKVHRTGDVLHNFGRTLNGATSGRKYYGYASGTIILPHNKGGVLTFLLWNDHAATAPQTVNRLNITVGGSSQTIHLTTKQEDRKEFYREFLNQWGPAGGREVRVTIPPGTTRVDMNNSGSQTGIELSDIFFIPN